MMYVSVTIRNVINYVHTHSWAVSYLARGPLHMRIPSTTSIYMYSYRHVNI